ncbi:MAG: ABC transporter substrate-binding protein [Deltaproteobacteria bacterium]|nr:ABC transporter substrate-binding protein [Deltaproteobacteria bacterium]
MAGRRSLWRAGVMTGVISGLLLLGVVAPGAALGATKVRLGIVAIVSFYWPAWAAKDLGYFAADGLEAEIPVFDVTRTAVQALSTGGIELVWGTPEFSIFAIQRKGPVKVIAGALDKAMYDLIAGAKYKAPKDLKGTTIGVSNLRGGSTFLMQKMLAKAGLKYPGDYDMVEIGGTPKRFAAVQSGGVSASVVTEPTSFRALDEGLVILDRASNHWPLYQFITISVNTDWARQNRPGTVGVLKGVIRANHWLYDERNRDEALKILMKYVKMEPKYGPRTYDSMFKVFKAIPLLGEVNEQAMAPVLDIMVERKQADRKPALTEYADDSYRQEALAQLRREGKLR